MNAYRVWIISSNKNDLVTQLTGARFREESVLKMRYSAKQHPWSECFNEFLNFAKYILPDKAVNHEQKWEEHVVSTAKTKDKQAKLDKERQKFLSSNNEENIENG